MSKEASIDDFKHKRDKKGGLLTIQEDVELPNSEERTVEVVPISKGDLDEYEQMEDDFDNLTDSAIATVLERHFRTPDFRDETGTVRDEDVKDIPMPHLEVLLEALFRASGIEDITEDAEVLLEGNVRQSSSKSEQSSKPGSTKSDTPTSTSHDSPSRS